MLPTLWFRNTWSWTENSPKPQIKLADQQTDFSTLAASHPDFGPHYLYCQHVNGDGGSPILFTENETNNQALFGADNATPYVKDAFHRYVIGDDTAAVNPAVIGTKAAAHYQLTVEPGETQLIWLRLSDAAQLEQPFGDFAALLHQRQQEADDLYQTVTPFAMPEAERVVQRQAFAGLLWGKQFYAFDVDRWQQDDPTMPPPPAARESTFRQSAVIIGDVVAVPSVSKANVSSASPARMARASPQTI